MNGRRLGLTVSICSAALLVPLVWPLLTGTVFGYGDLYTFNIPVRYLYQHALAHGESVLWTSDIFSGFYIHGEGQGGFFHPLHQVLYRILPLGLALNAEMLASYAAAFAGMFVLLRRFAVTHAAALFGAMLFAFGGFNLLRFDDLNLVAVFVHVPWLVAAVDLVMTARSRGAMAFGYSGVALVLASAILLGFPQGVWWCVFTAGCFTLFRGAQTRRWGRVALVVFSGATGALIGAVQLLPTLDMAAGSIRPLLTGDFALEFSLHPVNVAQFWSPYAFAQRFYAKRDAAFVREFAIYSGAILTVALPWLWVRRHRLGRHRPIAVAASVFAAVTFVLALGRYGGLDVALAKLPVLDNLRCPVRYVGLCEIALIVLAAIAIDDLLHLDETDARLSRRDIGVLCVPALLSLVTLGLNAMFYGRFVSLASVPHAAIGTGIVLAVTVLLVLAAHRVRWALPALAVVTMADLGAYGIRHVWREPPQTLASLTDGLPSPGLDGNRNIVYLRDINRPGDLAVMKGYRLGAGYVGLPPRTNFHISSLISLQLSGTHWDASLPRWTPVPDPVPRARLLARAEVTDNPMRDFARVDLHEAALVEHPVGALQGPAGAASVRSDRAGDIVVDTDTPGRQLLALDERYFPGWRATIDGRAVDVVPIHGDFVGCVVEAGRHTVHFAFEPSSFHRGAVISLAGLAILAAGLVAIGRTAPKRRA